MKELKCLLTCGFITVLGLLLVYTTFPEATVMFTVASLIMLVSLAVWFTLLKYKINYFMVLIYLLMMLNILNLMFMKISVTSNMIGYILGMVLSLAVVYINKTKSVTSSKLEKFTYVMMVSIFLLLIAGPEKLVPNINGTKAWIMIGNQLFQITELIKVFYIVFNTSIVSNRTLCGIQKLNKLVVGLITCTIGFALISELGSLMLIAAVFLVTIVIGLPRKLCMKTLCVVIILVIIGTLCVLGLEVLNNTPEESFQFVKTLLQIPMQLADKVYARFYLLMNFKQLSRYGEAMQYVQTYESLALVSQFPLGRLPYWVTVNCVDTDFAFLGFIINFGLLFGWMYVLLFAILISFCYKKYIEQVQLDRFNTMLRILSLSFLVISVILSIACSTNLLPIMGNPVPFLSKGGSHCIVIMLLLSTHLIQIRLQNKEEEYVTTC